MRYRIAIGPSSFAAEDSAPLRLLEQAGCEIVPNPFGRRLTESEIIAHLDGVDGLIAGLEPLNRQVIESAPQLKAIARVVIGVSNVDFDAAADCSVAVSSTPDGPVQAVAEMTMTALLALSRQLVSTNAALHNREWKKTVGQGLWGTEVLVVGYGRIGRRVAELLLAFGAKVSVYDPYVAPGAIANGLTLVEDFDVAMTHAEVISLHASGTDTLLDAKAFGYIQDGALLLNAARGELVDEDALCLALDSGKLRGAWMDAFVEEPYTGRLCEYDQVLLTPHVGTYTRRCRLDMESAAVKNLLSDLGID